MLLKTLKYSSFFLCFVFVFSVFVASYFYIKMNKETQDISDIAHKIDSFCCAVVFQYPKNVDEQIDLFSKNLGVKNTQPSFQNSPRVNANGFFVFDINPQPNNLIFF